MEHRWLQAIQERIYKVQHIRVTSLCHVRVTTPMWHSLEQLLEPEDSGLELEAARTAHPIRAIALTRSPLRGPEAKKTQQEPRWQTTHGCEATKEIDKILHTRVTPLCHVGVITPIWHSLERPLEPEDSGLEPEGRGQYAVEAHHR